MLPPAGRGQIVGLLGGSFDPPHLGHVAITKQAMARFGLDRVWWLVSPGNPLKPNGPASMARRVAAARAMMTHPRVSVTDIEARLHTRYTADTLAALQRLRPDLRFVWLMGSDNLAQFHRWQNWRGIMDSVPIGVLARPGSGLGGQLSPAARAYAGARLTETQSHLLGRKAAPAWAFAHIPLNGLSSTAIRAKGGW
ncbi:nicotinate-nucleotide adenylyltransferase [Ketogulonicigenium robustum]|uniref:nicotinate-nucleotide adenylyltransferase n=1 Tax=Ketogulonicigenium robustum TaxID=92947 RepID=UPI001F26A519|nr:nicotinate-nucleotide adenylyltransferase [Ketogulonicigenium robustum]